MVASTAWPRASTNGLFDANLFNIGDLPGGESRAIGLSLHDSGQLCALDWPGRGTGVAHPVESAEPILRRHFCQNQRHSVSRRQSRYKAFRHLHRGGRKSRLFRSFPPRLLRALQKQALAFNSHDHGLLVSEFESNRALSTFFDMLSYNEAPAGQVFVSTMEAKDYPFYGTQWHPEKNNFEWSQNADYSNLPHSPNAIMASQATARFFLSEARKSGHTFPEEERDSIIYSAPLVYTGRNDWIYEQVYVFCPIEAGNCPVE